MNWRRFFDEVLPLEVMIHPEHEIFCVNDVEQLKSVQKALNQTNKQVILDYMEWKTILAFIDYLGKDAVDIQKVCPSTIIQKAN